MKLRGWMLALVTLGMANSLAIAQSAKDAPAGEQYVPRLGDLMNNAQSRHMKLWFAAKSANWELAAYELRQLRATLVEAATLFPGIPVTGVTTLSASIQSMEDSIKAKDGARFARGFSELTDGCNACHRSMDRGFVVMRAPTEQPFGNQQFAPQGKK